MQPLMGTSSFFRGGAGACTCTCICPPILPTFQFHSLLPSVRVKLHTTIHKHKAARASPTYIFEAIQNRGNSISVAKKIGRRNNSEDSKSEEADSVTDGGNGHRGNISIETELVLSDGEGDAQRDEFLELDLQVEENDEGNNNNVAFNWPPLVCCFGAAQSKFTPISARYVSADLHLSPNSLECNPAYLVRARGGPPSNVAIKLARLGRRVAFMGKVGNDAYGRQMVITLNMNNVQTRGLQVDSSSSTSISYMKLNHRDSKVGITCIKPCAEDSLLSSEINEDILREARMFHFNSMSLLTKPMQSTLFAAIKFSKKCGGDIFFDVNLPLPLWRPQEETWKIIQKAWNYSNVIMVSKQELEFLLDKDYFKRTIRKQYKKVELLECDPHTPEELSSLWHDDLKILLVNDGAKLHYYTTLYYGSVPGIEDPFLTGFSYDRSAGSDAFIAEIMSRLVIQPEIYRNHVQLHNVIRYATTSAIVAQGVISYTRQYATDSLEYKMMKTV
ncbi:fructokinase-like 1, chloroplastic isoform X2 [Cryptomeria japonica]|uniref:fructokinase-like 1, chloroplastic isoform X2 n=1 Tax=Cryptomeria japonica TaxID=3369 RepID=UPI0027DAB341|nr:fructokinase-like 1, chloroplastic isoform X2 [Cryptomeria japonica]